MTCARMSTGDKRTGETSLLTMICNATPAVVSIRRLHAASSGTEKSCQSITVRGNTRVRQKCGRIRSLPGQVGRVAMSNLKLAPGFGTTCMAVGLIMLLLGSLPLQAQAQAPSAAAHIQTYYQELMPTIRQAARLTVRERDKRFAPAITGAFDLATMTRLAVGPAWKDFSPAQQTAV